MASLLPRQVANLTACTRHEQTGQYVTSLSLSARSSVARRSAVAPIITRQPLACKAAAPAAAAVKPCCQAAVAAAATSTAQAALPEAVILTVVASLAYTALSFVVMALFPRRSSGFFASAWPFIPLALAYAALLASSWSPDTLSTMMPGSLKEGLAAGGFNPQFMPKLSGIAALFGRLPVTASFVLHILTVNLFAGRWCMLDGLRQGIPTVHSVLLCSVFGPLGVLSHYATKALGRVMPALKAEERPVTVMSEGGCITLLPYSEGSSA